MAHRKPASASRSANAAHLLLSANALDLLNDEGERYAALVVCPGGELKLKPLKLPEGTVSVTKILAPSPGARAWAPRISAVVLDREKYPPGLRFSAEWNDEEGVLVLVPQGGAV